MTDPQHQSRTVEHLRCEECVYVVNVSRFDGVAKLVCHCTHVDGEIDPVPVNEMEILPDRWEWVTDGDRDE